MENFDEPYCKAREYMEGTAEEKHLLKTDCIKFCENTPNACGGKNEFGIEVGMLPICKELNVCYEKMSLSDIWDEIKKYMRIINTVILGISPDTSLKLLTKDVTGRVRDKSEQDLWRYYKKKQSKRKLKSLESAYKKKAKTIKVTKNVTNNNRNNNNNNNNNNNQKGGANNNNNNINANTDETTCFTLLPTLKKAFKKYLRFDELCKVGVDIDKNESKKNKALLECINNPQLLSLIKKYEDDIRLLSEQKLESGFTGRLARLGRSFSERYERSQASGLNKLKSSFKLSKTNSGLTQFNITKSRKQRKKDCEQRRKK